MSSNTPDYVANRVLRELRELSLFERSDLVTTEADRRALGRVRRLCSDIGLNSRGRFST